MVWFAEWRKKWKVLAIGVSLVASFAVGQEAIKKSDGTKPQPKLVLVKFAIESDLEKLKSVQHKVNDLLEEAINKKSSADNDNFSINLSRCMGDYKKAHSLLKEANEMLNVIDLNEFQSKVESYAATPGGNQDLRIITGRYGSIHSWLKSIRENHEKLTDNISSLMSEISEKIKIARDKQASFKTS